MGFQSKSSNDNFELAKLERKTEKNIEHFIGQCSQFILQYFGLEEINNEEFVNILNNE